MGNYKKIDKDDILYIKNTIQDDERVLVGENINEEYSHDELSGTSSYPDVVVKAKSAEEIAAIFDELTMEKSEVKFIGIGGDGR